MRINHNDEDYRVWFKHFTREETTNFVEAGPLEGRVTRLTKCEVIRVTPGIDGKLTDLARVSVGVAYCNWKDQFEKRRGRRLAFKRAVESMGLDKVSRRQWWHAYHEQVGVKEVWSLSSDSSTAT